MEMDDEDGEEANSDAESVDGETGRPSKKKKGLRFEHLARHIRYVSTLRL